LKYYFAVTKIKVIVIPAEAGIQRLSRYS